MDWNVEISIAWCKRHLGIFTFCYRFIVMTLVWSLYWYDSIIIEQDVIEPWSVRIYFERSGRLFFLHIFPHRNSCHSAKKKYQMEYNCENGIVLQMENNTTKTWIYHAHCTSHKQSITRKIHCYFCFYLTRNRQKKSIFFDVYSIDENALETSKRKTNNHQLKKYIYEKKEPLIEYETVAAEWQERVEEEKELERRR